jgi:hypothetical protein
MYKGNIISQSSCLLFLLDPRPRITKAGVEGYRKESSISDCGQSAGLPLKDEQHSSSGKKHSSYVQNMTGGLKKMFGLLVGNKEVPKTDLCSSKSQHVDVTYVGKTPSEKKSQGSSVESDGNAHYLVDTTKQTMTKLVHTKEKVEKHVANLLLTAFGEQLICSQGKKILELFNGLGSK